MITDESVDFSKIQQLTTWADKFLHLLRFALEHNTYLETL